MTNKIDWGTIKDPLIHEQFEALERYAEAQRARAEAAERERDACHVAATEKAAQVVTLATERDHARARAARLEEALREMFDHHGCPPGDYCPYCQPARDLLQEKP